MLQEQGPDSFLRGVRVLLDEAHGVVHGALVDVGDGFAEKLAHAGLVELLQAVEHVEMSVVGDALPVELQVFGVFGFVDQLAQKEVDQFVEGVFTA